MSPKVQLTLAPCFKHICDQVSAKERQSVFEELNARIDAWDHSCYPIGLSLDLTSPIPTFSSHCDNTTTTTIPFRQVPSSLTTTTTTTTVIDVSTRQSSDQSIEFVDYAKSVQESPSSSGGKNGKSRSHCSYIYNGDGSKRRSIFMYNFSPKKRSNSATSSPPTRSSQVTSDPYTIKHHSTNRSGSSTRKVSRELTY